MGCLPKKEVTRKNYNINCQLELGRKPGKSSSEIENGKRLPFLGQRHLVAFWGFIFTGLVTLHRTTMSLSIVAMVNQTQHSTPLNNYSRPETCASDISTEHTPRRRQVEGEFEWSPQLQGIILGINFLTYVIGNFTSGRMAEKWGAKKALLWANVMNTIFSIITPFCAWWNVNVLIIDQGIKGLAQGFFVPPVFVVMANWFPRKERGLLSSFAMTGYSIGGFLGDSLTGWLCDMPRLGWPSTFYITGSLNGILTILFVIVFYEKPQNHPYISIEELEYITSDQESDMSKNRPPVPWKCIFTSVPAYALTVGMMGYYWAVIHFLSVHPTYMGAVLHYPMTENGLVSAFPLLAMAVGTIVSGIAVGWMTKKERFSVDALRKGCTAIYAFGFSFCLTGVILGECDRTTNVVCFTLSLFFTGAGFSSVMIVSGDMTPTFAGSLFGLTSAVSCTAAAVLPVVVGVMTKHETLEEWHNVFFTHITFVMGTTLVFLIFGSAEVQTWNSPESKTDTAPSPPLNEDIKKI